ncbi:Integrator complex subunit 10 [Pseudolycoriella hygida]|uniref:Integrator complex subunit 10 n=1 Tax=Pseudolycoriella hygida TaxID=35572 RepID=A0A9Q0MNW6_9DIPT|nr:Integrator complex subunit 10 [Pseudolycoriella hygida]
MELEENYFILKAKSAHSNDPYAAKAWILTAKTLYPNNFGVQFEAYLIEKAANNYEEAAKCLSYIVMTFQNQPPELWKEVTQLTSALRILEGGTTSEQDFYVKMFQHISYEVQHKILLLTVNHSDNNLDHCKLMLLLLKRFPQTIPTHSPTLKVETFRYSYNITDPKYIDFNITKLQSLGHTLYMNVLKDNIDLYANIRICFEANKNQYTTEFVNKTISVCRLIHDRRYEPLLRAIHLSLMEYSPEFINKCPIQKKLYFTRMENFQTDKIPPVWPEASAKPRLLETLLQGINNHNQFREILIIEALPLINASPPELPSVMVNRIMAICFEYYICQMFKENCDLTTINEYWTKIFEVLDLCGRIMKWEPFLPYNRNVSKDIYWQRLIHIVSSTPPRPSENKQILFCATFLFTMALQEYMSSVRMKVDDVELDYVLVEGFKDNESKRRKADALLEPPRITVYYPCNKETPICFVTAAQCWQLLHSNEILQIDFGQLLINVPVKMWLNRFLVDLAVYLGRNDEALNILKDSKLSNLEKNLRNLSFTVSQPALNIQSFDFLMKILGDMPTHSGQWVKNLSMNCPGRHLLVLPLSRRAIIQYCTKILVTALKQKVMNDPTCTDSLLGNLLVLLQLDWPEEQPLAEYIFNIIQTKGHFIYLQFTNYIICVDMIEQFMSMWYSHGGEVHLEFSPAQANLPSKRIGTRGADKGVKDDFKQIIKQQILKCNDDIETLIQHFITQEHMRLVQNIFEK